MPHLDTSTGPPYQDLFCRLLQQRINVLTNSDLDLPQLRELTRQWHQAWDTQLTPRQIIGPFAIRLRNSTVQLSVWADRDMRFAGSPDRLASISQKATDSLR